MKFIFGESICEKVKKTYRLWWGWSMQKEKRVGSSKGRLHLALLHSPPQSLSARQGIVESCQLPPKSFWSSCQGRECSCSGWCPKCSAPCHFWAAGSAPLANCWVWRWWDLFRGDQETCWRRLECRQGPPHFDDFPAPKKRTSRLKRSQERGRKQIN